MIWEKNQVSIKNYFFINCETFSSKGIFGKVYKLYEPGVLSF